MVMRKRSRLRLLFRKLLSKFRNSSVGTVRVDASVHRARRKHLKYAQASPFQTGRAQIGRINAEYHGKQS
ncbi:hypothetical protein RRSWK_03110 [Rhodopirellula sp. SWK7]|nr:hypothetical protein RRSWK_03110 [Rhodopirellula sp. SWK7]